METCAARSTQDQNFNVYTDGSSVRGKENDSKAQKKGGGIVGRKVHNDTSKSAKPTQDPNFNVDLDEKPEKETRAARLTQDQNFNVDFDGSSVGGKKKGSKAQKKGGGVVGRKVHNGISKSAKPTQDQNFNVDLHEKAEMETRAARLTQDQNFNVDFDGSPVKGEKNCSKAQKKGGGLVGRKVKPSAPLIPKNLLQSMPSRGQHDHQKCIKFLNQVYAPRMYYAGPAGEGCNGTSLREYMGLEQILKPPLEMEKQPDLDFWGLELE